jgi:(p)ppGpp synthase/HD superfamily hydrolase
MYNPDRYVAALTFAAERHQAQRFPGTDLPYIIHPVTVAAELIAGLAAPQYKDVDGDLAVTCALLHDTIEDTATTRDEVIAAFGVAVADGVAALSKDPALPKDERMADSLRRILLQPPAVAMVKLADRIANLSAPPAYWPDAKRRAYRDEARVILAALGGANPHLAARLGQRIDAYAAHFEP